MLALLAVLLTSTMFILKLLGLIAVSWLFVFTPVLLWLAVWVAVIVISVLVVAAAS